ncbi:aldose epimerase family protein [Clostridium sp. Cult1]|uniref:aldose epimerase family protein n=1 Tax=Clostridium sp. Cult1 TaxID=2079002 RepID=UPI001F4275FE|nr:aldose epimerase family protein [Clostridium sp. Cult1]MCF6462855.1 galactose-1-epimerase [Clostridium sp. Cult1]
MKISKKIFGIYKDQNIIEYTLSNEKNFNIKLLNYGGIIREINYKDKNRVLGFDNIDSYVNSTGYLGALVGRVAGRISNGKIYINNKPYDLDKNEGSTCLHGGRKGLSFQLWELEEEKITKDSASITLKHISPDMEGGFPGELMVYAKYTIDKEDSLIIEYFAETNKSTPITLTNHSYFNLNDDLNENILDHILRIDGEEYIKLDEKNIPLKISKVDGTPFDFRHGKAIREDMDLTSEDLKITGGYDHPFILNRHNDYPIELYSEKSGVRLIIETTEPVVILYTSNGIDEDLLLSGGEKTFKYQGVCLETQWFPDALNQKYMPKNILHPNERYYSKTKYSFKE